MHGNFMWSFKFRPINVYLYTKVKIDNKQTEWSVGYAASENYTENFIKVFKYVSGPLSLTSFNTIYKIFVILFVDLEALELV